MKWIIISEKKPEMYQRVLCILNDKTRIMLMLVVNNQWKTMDNIPLSNFVYPTHWMPLEHIPLPEENCYENCKDCRSRHKNNHLSKYMLRKIGESNV